MIQIDIPMPRDCVECPLMDEYAECALLGKFVAKCGRLPDCPLKEVEDYFLANADDAVEVVRCKDCRYFAIVNQPYDQTWCGVMHDSVKPDGYCYWGERREDDTD